MKKYLILLLFSCNEDNYIIPSGCLNEPDKELVCTMDIDYVCGCMVIFMLTNVGL